MNSINASFNQQVSKKCPQKTNNNNKKKEITPEEMGFSISMCWSLTHMYSVQFPISLPKLNQSIIRSSYNLNAVYIKQPQFLSSLGDVSWLHRCSDVVQTGGSTDRGRIND